jgi:hypothetical protein
MGHLQINLTLDDYSHVTPYFQYEGAEKKDANFR